MFASVIVFGKTKILVCHCLSSCAESDDMVSKSFLEGLWEVESCIDFMLFWNRTFEGRIKIICTSCTDKCKCCKSWKFKTCDIQLEFGAWVVWPIRREYRINRIWNWRILQPSPKKSEVTSWKIYMCTSLQTTQLCCILYLARRELQTTLISLSLIIINLDKLIPGCN